MSEKSTPKKETLQERIDSNTNSLRILQEQKTQFIARVNEIDRRILMCKGALHELQELQKNMGEGVRKLEDN